MSRGEGNLGAACCLCARLSLLLRQHLPGCRVVSMVRTHVIRHAKVSAVWIRLKLEPTAFILEIEDNGRGIEAMDQKAAQSRNGLRNMRKRMEDVGGNFTMTPASEGGTQVRLSAPLRSK